jgi:hypothetical protein
MRDGSPQLIEIAGERGLTRDLDSKAITIDNPSALMAYQRKARRERELLQRIDNLEQRLAALEQLLAAERENRG